MAISKKITAELLKFWIDHNYNVLFEGRHGTGKTTMVKECFESAGLRWRYFSGSTLDPWVDFCGIPRIVTSEKGNNTIEMVLPQDFADDTIQAIFMDEFNRSHKKVRDACMELIQFKSINGRVFKNLKVVWAAINPPGETEKEAEYQVENLDPALQDRFHIYVKVPFQPDATFFRTTFGPQGKNAVDWWRELPADVQRNISPRRLEYALRVHRDKGNMAYVLPKEANVSQLVQSLDQGTIATIARNIMLKKDVAQAKSWLTDANNINAVVKMFSKSKEAREFFVPLLPQENLVLSMTKTQSVLKFVLDNEEKYKFTAVIDSIVEANQNHKVIRYIRRNRVMQLKKPALAAIKTIQKNILAAKQTPVRWKMFSKMIETVTMWSEAKTPVSAPLMSKAGLTLYETMLDVFHRSQEQTVKYNYNYNKTVNKARELLKSSFPPAKRMPLFKDFVKKLTKPQAEKMDRLVKKYKV